MTETGRWINDKEWWSDPLPNTLYVDDDELIARLGVPKKFAKAALDVLDHDKRSGFPRRDPLWGNKRYWPAVRAYLDRKNGLRIPQNGRDENAA